MGMHEKLASLEEEIDNLKSIVIKIADFPKKRVISLKGALKGVKVSEEDIEESKRSLFKTGG